MLSADFGHLERDTRMVDASAAEWVHIDVMDGVFVPNISFGFPVLKAIRKATAKFLDVHLMIVSPEKYVARFAEAGADLVTFHLEATDDPAAKLGVFCTMPAIMDKPRNLFCEVVGTFLLVFVILAIGNEQNTPEIGMGSLGSLPVTMLIMAIGMSLGGTTGYAINPARDLPPRVAHSILPIRGKGTSGWGYSWVPVTGPVLGALAAGLIYGCVYMCG